MADSPRTTIVALLVQNGQAVWAHCGDSRLYWLRKDKPATRTLDHSYVEQKPMGMKTAGKRSAEYLAKMANRNVLFTCLGSPTIPIYDISPVADLVHGDRFLLCTDGLWSQFKEDEIASLFATDTVADSASLLIDLALKRGGRFGDNVTAIGLAWESIALERDSHANLITDTLEKEVFASTVQGHLVDINANDLHDLDIERSLQEINAAIQKTLPPNL